MTKFRRGVVPKGKAAARKKRSAPHTRMGLQQSTSRSADDLGAKHTPIPSLTDRAITLRQLRQIYSLIQARCEAEGWVSSDRAQHGALLTPERVTLHDVVEHLIMPLTSAYACSAVELLASGPQRPSWYVIHAREEPVHDMIACLAQHAADRGMGEDTAYWVRARARAAPRSRAAARLARAHARSARAPTAPAVRRARAQVSTYAASLHPGPTRRRASVADDGSVKVAPFVQAMRACEGAIVIADRAAAVFALGRNGYEVWLATVEQPAHFKFDCYTAAAGEGGARAVGLVDGFAVADGGLLELKARREAYFPASLAHKAHGFRVAAAKAPSPDEHAALLAAVGPKAEQEALDATVGARFTAPMLGRLLADESIARVRELGIFSGGIGDELRRHLRVLGASRLRRLSVLCPAERHPHRKAVEQLCAALPPTLEELALQRLGPVVGSAVAKWLQPPGGAARSVRALDLAHNAIGAKDAAPLAAALRASKSVQTLDLTCARAARRGRAPLGGGSSAAALCAARVPPGSRAAPCARPSPVARRARAAAGATSCRTSRSSSCRKRGLREGAAAACCYRGRRCSAWAATPCLQSEAITGSMEASVAWSAAAADRASRGLCDCVVFYCPF